jgi:uncharacterized membrane protein HdeD (DUF308 family)
MNEDRQSGRGYQQFRASLHLGMGIFYVIVGLLILYVKHFGAMELPTIFAYLLGALMIVYGIFRIWRGVVDFRNMPKRNMNRDFPGLRKNGEN